MENKEYVGKSSRKNCLYCNLDKQNATNLPLSCSHSLTFGESTIY